MSPPHGTECRKLAYVTMAVFYYDSPDHPEVNLQTYGPCANYPTPMPHILAGGVRSNAITFVLVKA